jgi:extradiol dioxygenase family protein
MDFSLPADPASLAREHDNTAMPERPRFHLAFPVRDLAAARAFYGQLLGCREGRSSDEWVDFDFFGHQIVTHLSPSQAGAEGHNRVDGEDVPVRHFGVVLGMPEWRDLAEKLRAAGVKFLIPPRVRFEDQPGEQATLFICDPSGNALEFKAFADDAMVFAR